VIELGCGTGLVGIVAAALGAAVTATDGEAALVELAALNYEANAHGDATGGGAAYRVVESDPGRSRH
jgi:predicted nicotinamide N-methyase